MGKDEETSFGMLTPNICRELEKNPGCPFVKQIITNSADIGWVKHFLKSKTVFDVVTSLSVLLSLMYIVMKMIGAL